MVFSVPLPLLQIEVDFVVIEEYGVERLGLYTCLYSSCLNQSPARASRRALVKANIVGAQCLVRRCGPMLALTHKLNFEILVTSWDNTMPSHSISSNLFFCLLISTLSKSWSGTLNTTETAPLPGLGI